MCSSLKTQYRTNGGAISGSVRTLNFPHSTSFLPININKLKIIVLSGLILHNCFVKTLRGTAVIPPFSWWPHYVQLGAEEFEQSKCADYIRRFQELRSIISIEMVQVIRLTLRKWELRASNGHSTTRGRNKHTIQQVSSLVDEYLGNTRCENLKTYQWTEPHAIWEVSYWKWKRPSSLRRPNSAASINSSHNSSVTGFYNRSSVIRHVVMSLAFDIKVLQLLWCRTPSSCSLASSQARRGGVATVTLTSHLSPTWVSNRPKLSNRSWMKSLCWSDSWHR